MRVLKELAVYAFINMSPTWQRRAMRVYYFVEGVFNG